MFRCCTALKILSFRLKTYYPVLFLLISCEHALSHSKAKQDSMRHQANCQRFSILAIVYFPLRNIPRYVREKFVKMTKNDGAKLIEVIATFYAFLDSLLSNKVWKFHESSHLRETFNFSTLPLLFYFYNVVKMGVDECFWACIPSIFCCKKYIKRP